MKLKLDEHLGAACLKLLRDAGHDVSTVPMQGMTSASDFDLIHLCRREERVLVTLDPDFSNPMRFPPHEFAGIVLRLPARPTLHSLYKMVETAIAALPTASPVGKPWTVETGRLRVYQDDHDDP